MKSSIYGSIATIAFIKNKGKICKSIEGAIKVTDKYCEELNLENDLSHMTKYRIINDLISSNIFVGKKESKECKLKLSSEINSLIEF